jgi:CBS domain-containing protein
MHAIDIMTSEVISADENATVPAVARLLAERGISAVSVVDKDDHQGLFAAAPICGHHRGLQLVVIRSL